MRHLSCEWSNLYLQAMRTRSSRHRTGAVWLTPDGKPVACVEKLKVLGENLEEIRLLAQDALEDAVLMGCDEAQFRAVLADLITRLQNPYPAKGG